MKTFKAALLLGCRFFMYDAEAVRRCRLGGGGQGSAAYLRYRRHVVAHGFELHGHAHDEELAQACGVCFEGLGGAGLDALAAEAAEGAGGAFGHYAGGGSAGVFALTQNAFEYVVVHVVEAATVAEGGVEVGVAAVFFPVFVPVFCYGHPQKHRPAERHDGVLVELADAVGQVGLAEGGPERFDVGAFGQAAVDGAEAGQVLVQVVAYQVLERVFGGVCHFLSDFFAMGKVRHWRVCGNHSGAQMQSVYFRPAVNFFPSPPMPLSV